MILNGESIVSLSVSQKDGLSLGVCFKSLRKDWLVIKHDEPEQTGCSKIRGVWLLWCDVMIRLSSYHRFRFVVSTGGRSVITLTPLCTTSNGVNPVYFEGLDFSFDFS